MIKNSNVYEQWQKREKDSCHYGLKLDKLTNIFYEREELVSKSAEQSAEQNAEQKALQDIHKNINEFLKENRNLYENIDFNAEVLDKLVVGLGEHSVFETNLKIHHTYGVAYIPASAVKGCFRSHIIQKYFGGQEDNTKEDQCFIEIFGGENSATSFRGNVIFIDSFPYKSFEIKKDVMTPHYQNEYTDCGNITPIKFLAVKNTCFRFALRINNKCLLKDDNSAIKLEEGQDVRDFIAQELVEMITTHGIGAKTSVGYGYFKEITKEKCLEQTEKKEKERENEILEEKEKQKLNKMTESEKKLYLVEKIDDYKIKKEKRRRLFTDREKEQLEQVDIEKLASLIKQDLEKEGKWEYRLGKNGKKNKALIRIEDICKILGVALPSK